MISFDQRVPWWSRNGEDTMGEQMRPRGKRGIYYAAARVRSPDGNPVLLQDCLGTTDPKLAKKYLEELKFLAGRGDYKKLKISFSKLIEQFIVKKMPSETPANQDFYPGKIQNYIRPFFGDMRLLQITDMQVINYKTMREESGATESTLRKELRLIKKIMRQGHSGFSLPDWKSLGIGFKHRGKSMGEILKEREEFFNEDFILRIIEQVAPKYRAICRIAMYSGLRLGDIVTLSRGHIKGQWIDKAQNKTGHRVQIPIHPKLGNVFSSLVWPLSGDGLFFPNVNPRNVTSEWRRATKKADCSWFRFHDLRHYVASTMANNGVDLYAIKEWLGHRDVKTTQIYLHPERKILERAATAFDPHENNKPVCKSFANYRGPAGR